MVKLILEMSKEVRSDFLQLDIPLSSQYHSSRQTQDGTATTRNDAWTLLNNFQHICAQYFLRRRRFCSKTMEWSLRPKHQGILKAWLDKKGHVFKTWRRRFFCLDTDEKCLMYYADKDMNVSKGRYMINTSSKAFIINEQSSDDWQKQSDGNKNVLALRATSSGKESYLIMAADSEEVRDKWHEALQECIFGVQVYDPGICSSVFRNTLPLEVVYMKPGNKDTCQANDGELLAPSDVALPPSVSFEGSLTFMYTIVMLDPDVPSREFIHWAVVNIPGADGKTEVGTGETVLPYLRIAPFFNSGIHRFFFLLFRQKREMSPEEIFDAKKYFEVRGGLKTCDWAEKCDFGVPVGINVFVSKWDESVDDIHDKEGIMPTVEYQSPKQMVKFALLEQERLRMNKLKVEEDERVAAQRELERKAAIDTESQRQQSIKETQLKAERANEKAKQIEAAAIHDPILGLLLKYDIETRSVFEGCWLKKKFSDDLMYKKRFCWIDEETKRFYWSKVEGHNDPKRKYISLANQVIDNGVTCSGNRWSITNSNGKRIDLEVINTLKDDAVAADWAEVAGALASTSA